MSSTVPLALLLVFAASPVPCLGVRRSEGAGYLSAEPLKWEDSNIAKIGSDEDKANRKAAAQKEPAWKGVAQHPGLQAWRIEKFQVVPWPKDRYGEFYSGDSYIVLQTAEDKEGAKSFNIFFWLGKESTTDERGTAAYKTVELDDLLDGKAVQNREVQGKESSEFRSLFKKVAYLKGGVESGFNVAAPETYKARLLHVRRLKDKTIKAKEVTMSRSSLNLGDSFILDAGTIIYVWSGPKASGFEKHAAGMMAEDFEGKRQREARTTHKIDDKFWEMLGGKGEITAAADFTDEDMQDVEINIGDGVLYRMSDESGSLKTIEVGRGELKKSMLNSNDVMMLDVGAEVFVWIGSGASSRERRAAMTTGEEYLKVNGKSEDLPIHIYKEGLAVKNPIWAEIFAN